MFGEPRSWQHDSLQTQGRSSPNVHEGMNGSAKCGYVRTTEYHSVLQREESPTQATTGGNLEDIVQSEINQSPKRQTL